MQMAVVLDSGFLSAVPSRHGSAFYPYVEAKLNALVTETGRAADEFVQDALAGIRELAQVRAMLDSRYDDIKSGNVKPIDGEAFFESLRQREESLLKSVTPMSAGQGFVLHPLAAQDITDIWEIIAEDNPLLPAVSAKTSWTLSARWCLFPIKATGGPDLTSRPLRFKTVRDYLIAYAPDEHPLLVIAVLHGRRSPR